MHGQLLPKAMIFVVLLGGASYARAESAEPAAADRALPTVKEMIDARTDVWGDAAMRQPDGASHAFFKDLLPPLQWVNTEFRHYPIVLSAPRSPQKARLVSNGSAINPRANKPPMWNEQGVAVAFFVGKEAEAFGEDLKRLDGPKYLDGFLPIVQLMYRPKDATYREEVFAPVGKNLAALGTSMVRFSLGKGDSSGSARVEARIGADAQLRAKDGVVVNEKDQSLVAFGPRWKWDAERKTLVAVFKAGESAELAIFTKPAGEAAAVTGAAFDEAKRECIDEWKGVLARGIALTTPEPLVNDAWRAMVVGTYMLAVNDRLHYSAGNAYAKLYEGECGDVLRSIMLFGHLDDAPAMLKPLLEFDRKATRFHVAGHKLQLLAYFYWLTRDAKTVREFEPLWRPSIELILSSREPETGLLPKDNYAGDIPQQVYSLNSNANCWRALRDVAAMLDDMGSKDEAAKLRQVAAAYREVILKAVGQSERLDAKPPFIPVALLADEPAHDPLTATRTGSYYDLICPYVIGSEIFGQGSEREDWLLGYLQQHGGIAMGMIRTMPAQGQFKDEPGVNPLYGLRYQLALLRRDEREKALVGFYGQLAQGMTRGTFIGGEGSRFVHGDANGRSFYLPPNSASNAAWLVTLRYLLIQDWLGEESARPEKLRLMFGVPRVWLADGKQIHIEDAPTMFGPVSCRVESKLNEGYVEARVTPPPRLAKEMLIRAPLPEGWRVKSVEIDGAEAPLVNEDTVDLTGHAKALTVRFNVSR